MLGKITPIALIAILALPLSGWSQLPDQIPLNKPECGTWDSLYNRYLISLNIDNDIVQVDQNGVVTMFKENCGTYITSAGIGGTTFYQTDRTKVTGYDLATAAQVFYVEIPGSVYLGGPTADTSGNIYMPDIPSRYTGAAVDMIWKVRLSDGAVAQFADTDHGLGFKPRDIVFDPVQNRLIVTFMHEPVYIQAVSVADSTVTDLVRFETDYTNGIARDQFGNIYVAGYDNDTIYRYPYDFSLPAEVVSTGHDGPCNIDYDQDHNILIVPNYFADRVDFVRMGRPRLVTAVFSDVAGGDGDGICESGETVQLVVTLFNTYYLSCTDISLELTSASGGLTIIQGTSAIGEIPARSEFDNGATPFVLDIPSEYDYQENTFALEVTYTTDAGTESFPVTFVLPHDIDLDYTSDSEDNCPSTYNPDQSDADLDGRGNLCDACTDTDGDFMGDPGFPGTGDPVCPADNCPSIPNPFDPDSDGDGSGNACDLCPGHDDRVDTDGDIVPDACDNCPNEYNPGQEDIDGNDIGDVCEGCCNGRVGDANGEGDYPDEVTLGDIMLMVDVKFISCDCSKLPCIPEADVNQDGGATPTCEDHVTLGDIMYLVDFLFISGPENSTLPECL